MSDQAERLRERVRAKGLAGAGAGSAGAALASQTVPGESELEAQSALAPGEIGIWAGAGVDVAPVVQGLRDALARHGAKCTVRAARSEADARIFVTRADPAAVMAAYRAMVASAADLASDGEEPAEGVSPAKRWRGLWLVAAKGYPGGPQVAQAVKAAAYTYRRLHVAYLGTLPTPRRGHWPEGADLVFSTAALRVMAIWGGEGP